MEFVGFAQADFEVFSVPGLEPRMEALKANLRPKLVQLGQDFEQTLTELTGRPMYAHVAKHARRTVNPPNDSWVAFGHDKRGYKKHPHFQIGAWETHAFATFGLIYESLQRRAFAQQLIHHASDVIARIPDWYVWIPDHTNPLALSAREVDERKLVELANRLAQTRQGELLTGIQIPQEKAVQMTAQEFELAVTDCFQVLLPLYHMALTEVVPS